MAISVLALFSMAVYLRRAERARRLEEEERRRAEELQHTSRFLDAIVENLPNMIFIKDAARLAFVRINRAGEELLGMQRAELLGKSDYDFFPREEAEFFQAKDREALRAGGVLDIPEEKIETRQGPRWLHTKKVAILGEDGEPAFLLGISEDITAQKQAAEALRRAKEAAEASNRELEAFSYSVSHDLRAPLRSIDGFSQALLEDYEGALDAQGRDYLRRVRAASQRMAQLIDDLLGLSRLSRAPLRRGRVDLSALGAEVAAELRQANPGRRVELHIQAGLIAEGDERLLRVALVNLLGNAWKFTARRPEARVELSAEEGRFLVRDNGAGFDMSYADKLFGAFQRLHSAAEFEGTGIGLAIVQRIIHRHGGRIWAEAEVGRGATFYFTLPEEVGLEEGANGS